MDRSSYDAAVGTGRVTVYGQITEPGQTCQLRIDPDDGPNLTRNIDITDNANELIVTIQPGVSVSGTVSDGVGGSATWGWVDVYDESGAYVAYLALSADGRFGTELVPGRYRFNVLAGTANINQIQFTTGVRDFTSDVTDLDLEPRVAPVDVTLLNADASPASCRSAWC